jgi:hypothetical protein
MLTQEEIPQMQTHPHSNSPSQWQQLYTLSYLLTAPTALAEQKPRLKTPQQTPLQQTPLQQTPLQQTPLQQTPPSWHYYKTTTPSLANHTHSNFIYWKFSPTAPAKYMALSM